MASLYDIGFNPETMFIDDSGQIRLKNEEASRAMINAKDYKNYKMSTSPVVNSEEEENDDKFNFIDYLPFGSKSISGSIMRGIGQYMPDMDPRQKNLNQFYDVNNGTIQSGLMKDYNPVSGGLFGTPINYGLQDAYQKRIDTINNTLKRKYTNKGLSFDNTELDERRDKLIADMNNESNAMSGGGDGTFGLGTQGQKSYSNPGDTFGTNAITGGPVSNKTGKGRTDYMGGGRAGYFFGGRIGFAGGGMDMGNEENQAQSAAIGTGTPGPGDTGGEGGDNPSDDSDTQFSGGDNPPTNIGNPFGYQDNIMESVLSSRMNKYGEDMEEDINNPYSMENMFGITSQILPENTKLAGLNQTQVDFLDKIGKRNLAVNNNDFYTYDTPTSIKNKIENLNSKSTNMFGTFKPEKIVEGDVNTFATDKDVENYMKNKYKLGTANNKLGLAKGGRAMFKNGGLASIL